MLASTTFSLSATYQHKSIKTIKTWFIDDNLYELAEEEKIKFIYLSTIDGGYDGIKLFLQTIEDFGTYMPDCSRS